MAAPRTTRRAWLGGSATAVAAVAATELLHRRRPAGVPLPPPFPVPPPAPPQGEAILPEAFGGSPDGTSDNFAALSAAMRAAATARLPVFLSPGTWYAKVRGWGGVPVPAGVEVYGTAGTVCTSSVQYEGYPLFGLQGDNYVHDLTFEHPRGGNMIGGRASNLRVARCLFRHCCLNSLFACVDSVIEDCVVNGAATRALLARPLYAGRSYAALSVHPLAAALKAGDELYVYDYARNAPFGVFQVVRLAAAAPAGARRLAVRPFVATQDLPDGAQVQQIVVATGIAMTGDYPHWSTAPPGPGGHWCVNSTIQRCTVLNCNAADIFINMGYRCLMQDNRASVGHDMNFDFEFCLQSTMRRNEGHYGGNRGCAVESINSQCQILDNEIHDTTADGIRVTTDGGYIPAGNPYTTGGHLVKGNTVQRARRGIAIQAAPSTLDSNTVQNCALGVWLNNLLLDDATLLTQNTITDNYGDGIALNNSGNVTIDATNTIQRNGYLGSLAPLRAALSPTVAAGASTLAADLYALTAALRGAVSYSGATRIADGPPSLPAVVQVTSASAQRVAFDAALPTGAAGVTIGFESATSYAARIPWYNRASKDFTVEARLSPPRKLASIAPDGTVTYLGGATAGVTATVSGGTLHVVLTAAATSTGPLPGVDLGAAVHVGTAEGNNSIAAPLADNGYAGAFGFTGQPLPVTSASISGHTAVGLYLGKTAAAASRVAFSGGWMGAYGGDSSGGGGFTDCSFDGIAGDCIRYESAVNGAAYGFAVSGCKFGVASACGTGIWCDATLGYPGNATSPAPGVVQNCTFAGVSVPIDQNGGTATPLTVGAGNTGA